MLARGRIEQTTAARTKQTTNKHKTKLRATRMVQRTGKAAKLPFPVHPHMLRHSTGYKLANDGHDNRSLAHYLGHRNLQSTARYTALAEGRFAQFWRD
jgi:type 1 fimbriae regulatory protein FimE